jgi:predicted nuclease of predicted toxin-antitoxin system
MLAGLYMDVHVPGAVTEGLRRLGVSVVTSQEDGTRRNADDSLLVRATELNRLLVTQDGDFLTLAAQWQASGRRFTGVVYTPQLRITIGRFIEDLELLALCTTAEELADRVTYLPLR